MIHAIETEHNGYLFRSRSEAKWSVFFEMFGVGSYYYEREGYEGRLSDGRKIKYLPDFYIPYWDIFVEVKGDPKAIKESDIAKWEYISGELNKRLIVLIGDAWPMHQTLFFFPERLEYAEVLDFWRRYLYGYGAFCKASDGSRFLTMYVGGYIPSLWSFTFEHMYKYLEGKEDLLSKPEEFDAFINPIIEKHCQYREFSRICVFPLDHNPHYPVAMYKEVPDGEEVNLEGKCFYRGHPSSVKNVALGKNGNLVLRSANAMEMRALKFEIAHDAYKAARQARFEHKNGGFSSNVL